MAGHQPALWLLGSPETVKRGIARASHAAASSIAP